MRLCLVSRPQIVLLDYTEMYIQCESGLALASFLPPVIDHNVLQAIKNWRREQSGNETSLAPCRPLPSLDSLQYNHAKMKGGLAT